MISPGSPGWAWWRFPIPNPDHRRTTRRTRAERRFLRWIGAPDSVRLTCQARLRGDVSVHAAISPIERIDYDPSDYPWTP